MKMLKTLKTIRKRLLPDRLLLETREQIGVNVVTEIRLHSSLHRLLEQQLRCNTMKKSIE